MMRKTALFLFMLSALPSAALAGSWRCAPVEPQGWTRCVGSVPEYSKKVAVYYPKQSKPVSRIYLHLHGFRIRDPEDNDFVSMMDGFSLPKLAAAAGMSEGMIVVPESSGKCTTYINELQGNFERFYSGFIRESASMLSVDAVHMKIALSGHSGAFMPMQKIVRGKGDGAARINRVVFLDASYGSVDVDAFAAWLKRSSSNSFYAVYLAGTATASGASSLRDGLSGLRAKIESLPASTGHCGTIKARFGKAFEN